MKFVFASDSFKGSLSSRKTAELLNSAAREVCPGCETLTLRMADGGEGTLDAVLEAVKGRLVPWTSYDPLMNEIETFYGEIDDNTAIIEAAMTSGLTLVPEDKRNPMYTSSYGTGEMVKCALNDGYTNLIIGIGGTATNDGGMGFMQALGVRFLDKNGNEVRGMGCDLDKVCDIDVSNMMPEAKKARFTIMCDVTNPLCGENGATYTYGRQKGGNDETLDILERGMINYKNVIKRVLGKDPDVTPGAGAAGGLGAAFKVFLNATMRSGINVILDIVHFEDIINGADLIVTGEGRLDRQSMNGKTVFGIGERARGSRVPVYALCGSLGEGYEGILRHGISKVFEIREEKMSIEESVRRAEELYIKAAKNMFKEFLK